MNKQFKKRLQSTVYIATIATTLCSPLAVKALSVNQTEYQTKEPSVSQLETVKSSSLQTKPKLLSQAVRINLSGRWRGDDGGTYYIKQIGNELWWYGESADKGASWTNVFHGYIGKQEVAGKWADTPKGRVNSGGEMAVQIVSSNRLVAARKTGGFGGGAWTRIP